MNPSNRMNRRKRIGLASLTVLAMGAGLVGYAGAQDGPSSDCVGSEVTGFGSAFFGTEDHGNRLLSSGPTTRDFALTSPLEAGTYDIDAVSYDGYSTRDLIPPQPREQWFAEFLDADGTLIATTGTTADVADGVMEATWAGSIGQVTLGSTATAVRIVHAFPGDPSVNSVRPICIGAELVPDELPPSSVTVNFENTADIATPVGLDCGNNQVDGATGKLVELYLDELEPSTVCVVSYADGSTDCDVSVTDNAASTRFVGEELSVGIPDEGGADIVVDISCSGIVSPPSTTAPEVVPTPATTIAPQVDSVTEVATPIDMNPAFTG